MATSTEARVAGCTLLRPIGSGASGEVYVGRDADGTFVAVKKLRPAVAADMGFREMFDEEARLLASVRHPNVVRLVRFAADEHPPAIVMELVEGVSLRVLLDRTGPTAPEAALLVLRGSLLGLAAAHDAGVVHRDYKPDNVLVDEGGTSRLVDFGIAVRSGRATAGAGTPLYTAPEQWFEGAVTRTADVYAATLVFFECLTGHVPFFFADPERLRAAHLYTPIPVAGLPEGVRELVARGAAKDPRDRYPGIPAFIAALDKAAKDSYGADWAARGRKALAASVVGLAALLPVAGVSATGGVATGASGATTVAGGGLAGMLLPVAIAGAAVIGGAVAGLAIAGHRGASTTVVRPAVPTPAAQARLASPPPVPLATPAAPATLLPASAVPTPASVHGAGSPPATSRPTPSPQPGGTLGRPGADPGRAGAGAGTTTQPQPSAAPTVALSPSASRIAFGAPLTLRATVTSPAGTAPQGTVDFVDTTGPVASGVRVGADGVATFTTASLDVGDHILRALFSGDAAHARSSSAPFTETVTTAPTTLHARAPQPRIVTEPGPLRVTLDAVLVRSDDGRGIAGRMVAFSSGASTVCTATTAADGSATCTVTTLPRTLLTLTGYTVTFAGDHGYARSSSRAGGPF